jgi:hypothetical protein
MLAGLPCRANVGYTFVAMLIYSAGRMMLYICSCADLQCRANDAIHL